MRCPSRPSGFLSSYTATNPWPAPLLLAGCLTHASYVDAQPHRIISGLMYRYVPVSPVRVELLLGSARDRPKSPRRATPAASMNTLEGFTSRCSTGGLQDSSAARARHTCRAIHADTRCCHSTSSLFAGNQQESGMCRRAALSPGGQDARYVLQVHAGMLHSQHRATARLQVATHKCRIRSA